MTKETNSELLARLRLLHISGLDTIKDDMMQLIEAQAEQLRVAREALVNARNILRVENLLESWAKNVRIIDKALSAISDDAGAK